MEPVGFTIGVVGLVGTFTACVDCFDYVRIGKRLGQDYETAIIKLDVLRLRFTRWGGAIGIGSLEDENATISQLGQTLDVRDEDIDTIQRTLGQILLLFERSAKTSKALALKNAKVANFLEEVNPENTTIENLHGKMRNLAIQRQKCSTTIQKISWALYRKRDVEMLIEDLANLVTILVELAPAKPQQQLCSTELEKVNSDQDLVVLDNVLRGPNGDEEIEIDNILQQCVTYKIEQRKKSMTTATWKGSKAGDNSNIRQGDNVASDYPGQIKDGNAKYVVEDSNFGDNVHFHQGHNYGSSVT